MQLPPSCAASYRPTRRIASSAVTWRALATGEPHADADVHQARRADRRRIRLDEIVAIEQVLRAKEHLQAAADVAQHREIDRRVSRKAWPGERVVARSGERRGWDEVDVLIVVVLQRH